VCFLLSAARSEPARSMMKSFPSTPLVVSLIVIVATACEREDVSFLAVAEVARRDLATSRSSEREEALVTV
jgi:hypothetical protein